MQVQSSLSSNANLAPVLYQMLCLTCSLYPGWWGLWKFWQLLDRLHSGASFLAPWGHSQPKTWCVSWSGWVVRSVWGGPLCTSLSCTLPPRSSCPGPPELRFLTSGRQPRWVCSPLCAGVWKLPLRLVSWRDPRAPLVSAFLGIPDVCCPLFQCLEIVAKYICTVFWRFMVEVQFL